MAFKKEHIPWNKGLTKETDPRLKRQSKKQKGQRAWSKGLTKETDETVRKRGKKLKGKYIGEKNPNWKGGISLEPYDISFNNELKEFIRHRDNYKCQLCGKPEIQQLKNIKRKLSIHHIDYTHKNSVSSNLTTLCGSCNSKINFQRDKWKNYFKNLIKRKGGLDGKICQYGVPALFKE